MINVIPYVLFDGNCAEAMVFYQSCLGGDLKVERVGDGPLRHQLPEELHGKVLNARLEQGAIALSASDWLSTTRSRVHGNSVCLYLREGTYAELRAIFDRLAMGADESLLDDLREMPFGTYGALTDRFGVRWMFQGSSGA